MVGQPPSEDGSSALHSDLATNPFHEDLHRILRFHNGGDDLKSYQDVVMDERLDEKETMFMDGIKLITFSIRPILMAFFKYRNFLRQMTTCVTFQRDHRML